MTHINTTCMQVCLSWNSFPLWYFMLSHSLHGIEDSKFLQDSPKLFQTSQTGFLSNKVECSYSVKHYLKHTASTLSCCRSSRLQLVNYQLYLLILKIHVPHYECIVDSRFEGIINELSSFVFDLVNRYHLLLSISL